MKYIFVDTDNGTATPGVPVQTSSSWPAASNCFAKLSQVFTNATAQAETDSITVYCKGVADDTVSTTLSDTMLSANITVVGETTTPVFDGSKYYLRVGGSSSVCFTVSKTSGSVTLKNLQVGTTASNAGSSISLTASTGTLATTIDSCIVNCGGTSTSGNAISCGGMAATGSVVIKNCILWCETATTGRTAFSNTGVSSTASIKFYNNIVQGFTTGLNRRVSGGANIIIKNNAVFNCTTDIGSGSASITVAYNATDDGVGTNAVTGITWTNVFEDYANNDYRVKAGNPLIGAGIGPSADANVPTTDFAGTARTGATTDIGVSVYVSTGPSITITSISPASLDSGETFTITGTGFGATQGLSLVQIGGVTQTVTSWSDSTIVCTAVRGGQSMGNATLTVYKM